MKQLNLNVTPEFERDLRSYMRLKSIPTNPTPSGKPCARRWLAMALIKITTVESGWDWG